MLNSLLLNNQIKAVLAEPIGFADSGLKRYKAVFNLYSRQTGSFLKKYTIYITRHSLINSYMEDSKKGALLYAQKFLKLRFFRSGAVPSENAVNCRGTLSSYISLIKSKL